MSTEPIQPAQWALAGIESGWSATAGLDRFRAEGGRIANQTWFRLWTEINVAITNRSATYNEPLNLRPIAAEIKQWTTAKATGYVQQVEVLVREKATGQIISVPFSVTGRSLVSRRNAIQQALSIYSDDNAKKYNQQILGAVYSGTYEAVPSEG
jgi:hypothetical protein